MIALDVRRYTSQGIVSTIHSGLAVTVVLPNSCNAEMLANVVASGAISCAVKYSAISDIETEEFR